MKDLLDNEIFLGSRIAYPFQVGHWVGMRIGKVVKISEKGNLSVQVEKTSVNPNRTYSTRIPHDPVVVTRVDNVIVLEGPPVDPIEVFRRLGMENFTVDRVKLDRFVEGVKNLMKGLDEDGEVRV